MPTSAPGSTLDRFLPGLASEAPELLHRGRALLRAALWAAGWGVVMAALVYRAGRPQEAAVMLLSGMLALAVLPRFARTSDPPRTGSWLATQLLVSSFVGAALTGGMTSPLGFAASLAAATRAMFGNPHGVAWALLVPVGLFGLDAAGLSGAPLPGLLEAGATLATMALVTGASAELVLGERSSRAAIKARALREGSVGEQALRRELENLRRWVAACPADIVGFDADGRILACIAGNPAELRPGSELIAHLARCQDVEGLAQARAAFAAAREGASAAEVAALLPEHLRGTGGAEEWVYGAEAEGGPFVGLRLRRSKPSELGSLSELCVGLDEHARGARLQVRGAEQLFVPSGVAAPLLRALEALVDNARRHGLEGPAERLERGKPTLGTIEVRVDRRGGSWVVAVIDDGRGFPWAELADAASRRGRACGSRVELEAAAVSRGLSTVGRRGEGLALAAEVAAGLGGRFLVAASEAGEGTVMELMLPLRLPEQLTMPSPASGARPASGRESLRNPRYS